MSEEDFEDYSDIVVHTSVDIQHKKHKYEYDARGLKQGGHYFDDDVGSKLPEFFKNGKVRKRTIKDPQPIRY